MRVHLHGDDAAGEFAGQLLAIGDGKYPIDTSPDIIQLPESIGTFVCNIDELVSKVYPDLLSNFRNMDWLREHHAFSYTAYTLHDRAGTLASLLYKAEMTSVRPSV